MSTDKTNQSWGGRFSEPVDAFVARFTASVTFDQRLYRHDIMGSVAHATMLAKVGVLTDAERDTIIDGLKSIQGEIEAGTFDWRVDLEDVHMNIEARLTDGGLLFKQHFERIGELMRTLATTGYDMRKHGPEPKGKPGPPTFMFDLSDALADLLRPDEHRLRMPIDDLARMYLGLLISIQFSPDRGQDGKSAIAQRVDLLLHGALRH